MALMAWPDTARVTTSFLSLSRAMDLLPTPCTLIDLRGRIVHVNPANARLLGRTAGELRGQPVGVLLPPELREGVAALLKSVLVRGELRGVFPNVRPDGSIAYVEVAADVVRSPAGIAQAILASVRDLGPELALLEQLSASALRLASSSGDDLLPTVVRTARVFVGARYAAFALVDGNRLVRFVPDGLSSDEIGAIDHWPEGHGLLGALIRERRTIRIPDISADPRTSGFPAGHPPMRSFLGTPVRTADEVLGHLYFTNKRDADGFSILDERLAELFAAHAALAITQVQHRASLEASQRHLARAQRIAGLGSWERDVATGALRWSDESHRLFGLEPGTFIGTLDAFLAFVHPDDRATAVVDPRALDIGGHDARDYRIVRADGVERTMHEEAEAIHDETGAVVGYVGTTQDITERVAAEGERARLISAVEQTADSIMITHGGGTIAYTNPSFTRLYGYPPEEVMGQSAAILGGTAHDPTFWSDVLASIATGGTWSGSIVNRRKDGAPIEVETVISAIRGADGRITDQVQTDRDITRERELERTVERDARDRESIEAALERIDPGSSPEEIAAAACAEIIRLPDIGSAVVFDLTPDREVRLAAAGRLTEALGRDAAIPEARFRYLRDRARAGPWTERWQQRPEDGAFGERLTESGVHGVAYAPFRGHGDAIGIIGIGAFDAATAERLVDRLPALVTFGSIIGTLIGPGLGTRHRTEAERARIQATIDAAAFSPAFQPIVNLHDGTVVGHEALTRFADGQQPGLVFQAAARAGLGIALETACLRAALKAARRLPGKTYLSLNASPELILAGNVGALLTGLRRPLVLEVTEHVAIDDYNGLRRELKRLGPTVRLAVDDAGAGYASFRHILELRPDFVKIDMGLVRGVDAEPARQALIAGMGYFAVKRKLHLIAEGIATRKELRTLRSLAVPYGQGYLLGRPQHGHGPEPWPTRIDLRPFLPASADV